MLRWLGPLLAGALFGTGLLMAGMTDPARVRGFLDVTGAWDPTLAFVLGGAVLPMAVAWRIAARRPRATGERSRAVRDVAERPAGSRSAVWFMPTGSRPAACGRHCRTVEPVCGCSSELPIAGPNLDVGTHHK